MCADQAIDRGDASGSSAGVMNRRLSDVKKRLLGRVCECAADGRFDGLPVDPIAFIHAYYQGASPEDLRERKPTDLAGAALSHLKLAMNREPGVPALRIFNPQPDEDGWHSTHTIVMTVVDDMPFLVDSLGLVLNRSGMGIHLTVHPVLAVRRGDDGVLQKCPDDDGKSESFMCMEVNRETNPATLDQLRDEILEALDDVRGATQDWRAMRSKVLQVCDEIAQAKTPLSADAVDEGCALLRWMEDDHFTFLGYREYELVRDDGLALKSKPETGLGILRGQEPSAERQANETVIRAIRKQARSPDLLIITKANSRSTVHRPGYLDYIGVKTFGPDGKVCGEKRFLGLFTSFAYSRSPHEIPVLRQKVASVMARSGLQPASHGAKALMHILETYPRDELFQISVEDLARISEGILSLQERQRIKMFIRRDAFRRFLSCLVYVPRDKYNTQVRERIEHILQSGFGGTAVESTVQLSESNLARLHTIVRTPVGTPANAPVRSIETNIRQAIRTWRDELKDALVKQFAEEAGLKYYRAYADSFPAAYSEDVSPREAGFDIERIDRLGHAADSLEMSLYRPPSFPQTNLRFKVFRRHQPIPISDALPMLENMGLKVIAERPYQCTVEDGQTVWIQDFEMHAQSVAVIDPKDVNQLFQDTFANTWRGLAENDGFNRLVLQEKLSWRQVALLRAVCKYLLQAKIPFSQPYMESMMCANGAIARLLVRSFEARFDPTMSDRRRQRESLSVAQELDDALDSVQTMDADRILRAFLAVIRATVRTSFFRRDKDGARRRVVSFKLDCSKLPDLPRPRPMFEIFVYSPDTEGVHLRAGKVARGGLRWSDRREDFRTEVLGLMKAQTVKNTLIVPTGSKGGFVVKPMPTGTPDEIQQRVIGSYRDFIGGLLDVTDNLVDGAVVPPADVVRRDEDDPYLVVAADKGTATFSDIANGLSADYGFWLGDAFASGGSAGYDHKKMGITAKGAWEAVKRHFREIGVDVQSQPFTVAAIGDMGGDVFGNGMLMSPHIRLQAAFNHLHIFLDPDPDPKTSFAERKRLFRMPRSSWTDYDTKLISRGGGIYSRQDKHIALSPEVRQMLGVDDESLSPVELIRAILCAPVDLLWNGGIGTYVKAAIETSDDAGDRANDAVRVNAGELRTKVIGEGGNLGLTQLGRIEYALNGGRINTDFIDNSAGVDCSDHEVNIKILLNTACAAGDLSPDRRDKLLASMTDEVSGLVLRDNYMQTQALSMMENQGAERLNEYAHQMRVLERAGELDRPLEFLPDDEQIAERHKAEKGFTRPELSVLLSYSKISLYNELVVSDIADDPYLSGELARYFPQPLQRRYMDLMTEHPLRTEIIATQITNSMINRMGPTFARRTQNETGATASEVARAFTIARESYDMRSVWTAIEKLDNKVHAYAQYSMIAQTARLLRRATLWLLTHRANRLNIAAAVAKFQPGIAVISKRLGKLLVDPELKRFNESTTIYVDIGVPDKVARQMAGLQIMYSALDIVDVAHATETEEPHVASIYFRVGAGLNLGWILDKIEHLAVDGHWQAVARGTLRDNLHELQRELTRQVIEQFNADSPAESVRNWLEAIATGVRRAHATLEEMQSAGMTDFATLSVAIQEIRKLAAN